MTLLLEGCFIAVQYKLKPFREVMRAQSSLDLAVFPNADFFAHLLDESLFQAAAIIFRSPFSPF